MSAKAQGRPHRNAGGGRRSSVQQPQLEQPASAFNGCTRKQQQHATPSPGPAAAAVQAADSAKRVAAGAVLVVQLLPHHTALQVLVSQLGQHLPQAALASARLVCKEWAAGLFTGRKCAETAVVPCEKAAKARIDDIHRLMPGLASLTLRISGRRNPTTNFHGLGVLEHLEVLASLRTLVLHFTTPPDSVTITGSGKPPLGGLCDLAVGAPRLQELVVRGRTLTAMDLSALAQLPELATLILEGEPPGGTALRPTGAALEEPHPAGQAQLEALKCLTQLKRLELAASFVYSAASASTATHMPLAQLTGLTALVLRGAEVGAAFAKELAKMTGLKEVQCVLGPRSGQLEGTAGLARWSSKSAVALSLVSRTKLDNDLKWAGHRLKHHLTSLHIKSGILHVQAGLPKLWALTGLRSLSLEQTGFGGYASPEVRADIVAGLEGLSQLTSFKADGHCSAVRLWEHLPRLVAAWRGLEVLHVTSVTSDDLPGDALACLVGAAALRELHLAADNASKAQLRLDLAWLPRGLQRLRLRHAFLPCPVTHERLPHLQALAMAHCTYACCGHLQAALGGLPSLSCLELEDMPQLQDGHLSALSGLTGLTALSICAMGNSHFNGGSIMHLQGLTGLRQLRWHVGDLLDYPPTAAALKALTSLASLDVPFNTYWRMMRWSVTDVLDALPRCEVHTTTT